MRRRIGMRRWHAEFSRHDGTLDDHGQPTYDVSADYDVVVRGWPCEVTSTVGAEVVRGRMVNEKTTHVAFGEFYGSSGISVKDRCTISGKEYGIVNISDSDGLNSELRIELRGENDGSL